MTLDLDFANVKAYPPKSHLGIVVFRPESKTSQRLLPFSRRPRVAATLAKASALDCRAGRIQYREE